MYEIIFSDLALNQFSKLDKETRNRIGSAIERIKIRPHSFVKKLYNSDYYRLRVDDYRIIMDIEDTALIIYLIKIGKRSEVYK